MGRRGACGAHHVTLPGPPLRLPFAANAIAAILRAGNLVSTSFAMVSRARGARHFHASMQACDTQSRAVFWYCQVCVPRARESSAGLMTAVAARIVRRCTDLQSTI